ncbi:MAG: two-component regulator propeller domain-containing protein [Breznakibacter sp.]
MRGIFVLLALWWGTLPVTAQMSDYKFRRLDISNGLSNNQVRSIYVDKSGLAWFGTGTGLNRFDGYSFKTFKNNPSDSSSIPFNSISRIDEDYKGFLWIFNMDGILSIYDPNTETFGTSHEVFGRDVPVPANYISALAVDADSCFWIANSQHGVYKFDPGTGTIARLNHRDGDERSLGSDHIMDIDIDKQGRMVTVNRFGLIEFIDRKAMQVVDRVQLLVPNQPDVVQSYSLFVDRDGDLWVYSLNDASGLYLYSFSARQQTWLHPGSKVLRLNSSIVTGVQQDMDGTVWVGTDHGGINIIDKKTLTVRIIENEPGVANSLGQNSVTTLYADAQGIMWVGTFKNGLSYYHPGLFQFKHIKNNPFQHGSLPSNDINCFAEDAAGNLWIGTNGEGLIYYNRSAGVYSTYRYNPADPGSLSSDVVVSLCVDSRDRLWAGTYYGGLNLFDGRSFKRFAHNPADSRTIADNRIWRILEDSQKRIWIATLGGGLDLYDERENRFAHYKSGDANSIHSDYVLSLSEDKQGNLWVGTSNGVDVMDHRSGRIVHYPYEPGQKNGLSSSICMSMVCDKRGWTWVATRNGLDVFDPEQKTFRAFTSGDGLSDDNIMSVQDDDDGNIWVGTLNGISNLQVLSGTSPRDIGFRIRSFGIIDGLQGKEYNEHSSFKSRQGEIFFGGANGYNYFRPSEIRDVKITPTVTLTDLKLQNKSISIGEELGGRVVLPKAIGKLDELTLRHNQNVFSIEFSALNFLSPEKMRYRYMLEGFNEAWIMTDADHRSATYTNLNPGTYVFRVVASDIDGKYESKETCLTITVVPPFYASPMAMGLYAVFFVGLVILLVGTIKKREQLKYKREQEKLEHERMHELDNMKIRFFTNVSHEFRTPLTLILTPLDKLIAGAADESSRQQLVMVQRNGRRLLNLVNQLLDFRKMEVQSISVNLSFDDIVRFLKETTNSFGDLSDSKNIALTYSSSQPSLNAWFDPDKIEKVMFNLLNNAFKFTSPPGRITVRVEHHAGDMLRFDGRAYLRIKVSDTGIGISKDKQDRIFDRFFQAEGRGAVASQGSGIGLSLTQEFVKLHKGLIEVESEPDKGTDFFVCLPLLTDEEARQIDERVGAAETHPQGSGEVPVRTPGLPADLDMEDVKHVDKPVILIVEDNEDLRFYLKENLRHSYYIDEASNGADALAQIERRHPTLVVTDVMMPKMDGLELCRHLKNDVHTSHIPVVILTARGTNEQKLEGLEIGADEYITKPFNYELLELKIKKLIDQRRELQKSFQGHYEIKPGEIGVTSLDERFPAKGTGTGGKEHFQQRVLGRENEQGAGREPRPFVQ